MRKGLLAILIAVVLCLTLVGCGGASGGASEGASASGIVEATDNITIATDHGKFTFTLANAFVGDDAFAELERIGETPENFDYVDGYKTVLYEYKVTVDEGDFYGDDLSGAFYEDTERNSEITDYACYDFAKNNGKAAFDGASHISAGDSDIIYAAFGFPDSLTEYYDDTFLGVMIHYTLE